jgi:hypothetical protein
MSSPSVMLHFCHWLMIASPSHHCPLIVSSLWRHLYYRSTFFIVPLSLPLFTPIYPYCAIVPQSLLLCYWTFIVVTISSRHSLHEYICLSHACTISLAFIYQDILLPPGPQCPCGQVEVTGTSSLSPLLSSDLPPCTPPIKISNSLVVVPLCILEISPLVPRTPVVDSLTW